MNRVFVDGRLVKDITLKRSKANTAVADFTLAVDEHAKDKVETSYVDCLALGKVAETLKEILHKGEAVFIEGKVKKFNYKKSDGTINYRTQIVVNSFHLIKKSEKPQEEQVDEYIFDSPTVGFMD